MNTIATKDAFDHLLMVKDKRLRPIRRCSPICHLTLEITADGQTRLESVAASVAVDCIRVLTDARVGEDDETKNGLLSGFIPSRSDQVTP